MLELLRLLVRLRWPMRLAAPIFGRLHPYRPSYALDPYPTYRKLREEAPVYFHPVFRAWIVSRYEDVSTVLKSPEVSVRRAEAQIALSTLLRRCPDLRGDPQPAEWRRSVVLRGPLSLPVRR